MIVRNQQRKRTIWGACIALIILFFIVPSGASADPDPNFILSDSELVDKNSMALSRIQSFLESKGSFIAGFSQNILGERKRASDIIYDVAQKFSISPKIIITFLQKEQSLITEKDPTQKALDWALGFGVPDGGPRNQKYKGFYQQIFSAMERIREGYLHDLETRGYTISGWGPGITKSTLDGISVTPVNDATSVLYTYTPWYRNDKVNFTNIWRRYFSLNYPNGSILQNEYGGAVYIIKNGKKSPFWNRSAFLSRFDPSDIIFVSPNVLDAYEDGPPIRFADYTFIRSPGGTVCMLKGDQKFCVDSQGTLRQIGINPEEIEPISWRDYNSYEDGATISLRSIFPNGALLQIAETGGVYYVENGVRHAIWSKEILKSRYPNKQILIKSQREIDDFDSGDPVLFRDGEIITSSGVTAVYFISDGKRRRIDSSSVFSGLGLKWDKIITTTDDALMIHPEGDPLRIEE